MPLTTDHTAPAPRLSWLLLLGIGAALLTGCSSSGDDSDIASLGKDGPRAGASSEPGPGGEDALVAFRRCMQEQGVPIDDGGGTGVAQGDGGSDPNMQAAAAKCKHLLEGSGVTFSDGSGGDALSPEQLESLVDYARCMRENGIDIPDPDGSSGGLLAGPDGGTAVDPQSPEYKKADEACKDRLPGVDAEQTK